MLLTICTFLSALVAFIATVRYYKGVIAVKTEAVRMAQSEHDYVSGELHKSEAFIGQVKQEYDKMTSGAAHELDKLLGKK